MKIHNTPPQSPFRILVVEDDEVLNQQLTTLLTEAGYDVDTCFDGETGLLRATSQQHHLMILDVMLPKRDGFSVLNMLRKSSQLPVIMLTAKGAEEERIQGFSQGADDYVAKPFSTAEFLLRVEALLRRIHGQNLVQSSDVIDLDGLKVETKIQQVFLGEQTLEFTPIQFKLLAELLLHKGEVLSKAYLYQSVLNRTMSAYDRSLDMHLSRVRRKLNEAGWDGERLQTCHGKGYCLQ